MPTPPAALCDANKEMVSRATDSSLRGINKFRDRDKAAQSFPATEVVAVPQETNLASIVPPCLRSYYICLIRI